MSNPIFLHFFHLTITFLSKFSLLKVCPCFCSLIIYLQGSQDFWKLNSRFPGETRQVYRGSLLTRRTANFAGAFSYFWPYSPDEDFDSPEVKFDEFSFSQSLLFSSVQYLISETFRSWYNSKQQQWQLYCLTVIIVRGRHR